MLANGQIDAEAYKAKAVAAVKTPPRSRYFLCQERIKPSIFLFFFLFLQ